MNKARVSLALLSVLSLTSGLACDKASPVAPAGTLLTLSANPLRISTTGSSEIRVTATRPNGTPVNLGTQIFLSSSLGTIAPTVTTDVNGQALATLQATGRSGTATVSARVGGGESLTVDVEIGIQAGSLRLQVAPTTLTLRGDNVSLLATVWDTAGDLLPGTQVIFRSEVGSVRDGGTRTTDENGEARAVLAVKSSELDVVTADSFTVTAESAIAGGFVSDTATLRIARPPRANFTFAVSGLNVTFTDTSTGNPTSWRWTFGDPANNTSTARNPTFTFPAAGTYSVTLTVRNAAGEDAISKNVAVTGNP